MTVMSNITHATQDELVFFTTKEDAPVLVKRYTDDSGTYVDVTLRAAPLEVSGLQEIAAFFMTVAMFMSAALPFTGFEIDPEALQQLTKET